MQNNNVLILCGGWKDHQPEEIGYFFRDELENAGMQVTISDDPDILIHYQNAGKLDLIVMQWTDGEITMKQLEAVISLVGSGTGIAGSHAGLCSSFNRCIDWSFITGAAFTAHPGGDKVKYDVKIASGSNKITYGMKNFTIETEQYYMLIDPAVQILATTSFPPDNSRKTILDEKKSAELLKLDDGGHGAWNSSIEACTNGPHLRNLPVEMPVAWIKYFGKGRIFGCTLGHNLDILKIAPVKAITLNGFLWAANEL